MPAPETCPNCGADVPRRAKACPECGSDESTGWSDHAQAQSLDLPDDEFNYDEFVERELKLRCLNYTESSEVLGLSERELLSANTERVVRLAEVPQRGIPLQREGEVPVAHTGVRVDAFEQRPIDVARAQHVREGSRDLVLRIGVAGDDSGD